jgi:hypothetical protein
MNAALCALHYIHSTYDYGIAFTSKLVLSLSAVWSTTSVMAWYMPVQQGRRCLTIDWWHKHNEGKEACATRALLPVHQGQQCQRDKGSNTGVTAKTCQLDGGNNAGATTVPTPMQGEGKEVSAIRTTTPAQQGQQHPCNVGNGTSSTRATKPLLQWQRRLRINNGDDSIMKRTKEVSAIRTTTPA